MSDPSAINIPVNTALTSDLLYGLKPTCPKARSYKINIAPLNKSVFVGNDQIIFELPTGRPGTYLDNSQTFLKFSVQVQTTAPAAGTPGLTGVYIENTAYSFFQRCDTYHSSNLLETINEYGQLANFIIDTSLTKSDKEGLSSMIGANSYNVLTNAQAAYVQYNNASAISTAGDRAGLPLASTAAVNGSIPYTFALPFFNGVCGVNCSKMLPVGQLGSPLRIELYTSLNDDAIYSGTAGAGATWQLVGVELCCTYVELSDDIPSDKSQPTYISSKSWRQAAASILPTTTGEFTTLLPFRFASLCGLYSRFLPFASSVQGVNATAAYRKSCSINPNLSSYYFRCGAQMYPNKPVYLCNGSLVGSGSEGYAELLKSFHALSTSIGNSAIPYQQYNVIGNAIQGWNAYYGPGAKNNANIDTHANAFAIGLELENFSNRSDTILSGVSTLNTQIFFTGTINPGVNTGQTAAGAGTLTYTAHFFANYDMILVIQDGIMMSKF